jgi:uncharacterized protein HemY
MRRKLTMGLLFGALALSVVAGAESAGQEQRAERMAPNTAEAHMAAGMAAYWKLRFRDAERHFQAAVDADPGGAAPPFYLGYTVYKIAEPQKPNDQGKRRAADLFARAYQVDPGFTPDWRVPGRP